jgi:hypothetical protein
MVVDPRSMTEPVHPPYASGSAPGRFAAEAWDHLWPWSRDGFRGQRAHLLIIQAASLALAVAASLAWVLAAMGQLAPGAIIAWWFGWSVFEIVVRLGSKPYVKEGPWWGSRYRRAGVMDMICYVGFKNLMIGAVLFIGLKSAGLLVL